MKLETINTRYDGLIVCYHNDFARLNSKLTLEEEKILHLILSHLKPNKKNDSVIKIEKKDFFNKLDLKNDNKYPRYKKLITAIKSKSWVEVTELHQNNKTITDGYVISASKWHDKKNFFEVELSRLLMPFLENFIDYFTMVDLDSVVKFRSKHSLILYKYICSWTDSKKIENKRYITTKDLKELLGLTKESYVQKNGNFNRADFERSTILVALLEINKVTSLNISFKKNKKGKFVQNYEFTWTQKEENSKKDKKTKLILNKR